MSNFDGIPKVSYFPEASSSQLLDFCKKLLSDPMAVKWITAAVSPNQLNDFVVKQGWSNNTAIAFKAAYHLRERFPEIFIDKVDELRDRSDDRFKFISSPDLPCEFELELYTVMNGEEVLADEPLLFREIRGNAYDSDLNVSKFSSYEIDGKFSPFITGHRLTDTFFHLDMPQETYFGITEKATTGKLEFELVNPWLERSAASMLGLIRPILYYEKKDAPPRLCKFVQYWKANRAQPEGMWLVESLQFLVYKDWGPHKDRSKDSRGDALYRREYTYGDNFGWCLKVNYTISNEWKLTSGGDEDAEIYFSLNGTRRAGDYPKSLMHDHEAALANILLTRDNIDLYEIAGPQLLNNPPEYLLDLLIKL